MTVQQQFPTKRGTQVVHKRWVVDIEAAARTAGIAVERLTRDATEMAEHFARWLPAEHLPDEVAAFLYEPVSDAERAQRYTDLVAEPASQIETLRAAHVLARCAAELVAPVRTPWFTRVLADSTTCLLGGNAAGAYGITEPGQVIRLGVDDIAGTTDHVRCDVCQRELAVALRTDLPAVDDTADAAFS